VTDQPATTTGKRLTLIDAVFVAFIVVLLGAAPFAFFDGATGLAATAAIGALVLAAAMKWMPSTPRS
jgi:uncharacterized membrane protein